MILIFIQGLVLFIDWFMGPQPDIYEHQPLTPVDEVDATKEDKVKAEDVSEEKGQEVEDDEDEDGNQDKSVRKRKVKIKFLVCLKSFIMKFIK